MGLKDAWAYSSIAYGDNVFPFDSREGAVTFKARASVKIDEAKPHGKDVPKITVTGKAASKFKLELVWSFRIEEQTMAFLEAASPAGPNAGEPADITHPDARLYGIDAGIIEELGEIERTTGMGKVTLSGIGWKKSPKAAAGGAKVPAASKAAATVPEADDHIRWETSDGNVIDMGEGPVEVENEDGTTDFTFGGSDAPAVGE